MRARRPVVAAGAALVLTLVSLTIWWLTRDPTSASRRQPRLTATALSHRLDVPAFRARLAIARARAAELKRRFPRAAAAAAAAATPPRPTPGLAASMLDPQCILGPADLCATIADSVDACDAGDGAACLAVGQFLEDTPPRPLVALSFFLYACRAGDQAGCDRMAELKARRTETSPAPCTDDLLACGWRAMKTRDPQDIDDACANGVADACTMMFDNPDIDPRRQREYLQIACELGNPMACEGLAKLLSPDCKEDCFPADPEAAAAAATMACEVGFTDVCDRALPP